MGEERRGEEKRGVERRRWKLKGEKKIIEEKEK